jgi:hypothetical protein
VCGNEEADKLAVSAPDEGQLLHDRLCGVKYGKSLKTQKMGILTG